MASSVAGAGSKVLLLVGAGLTGSVLMGNTRFSELLNDLATVFKKHIQDNGDQSSADIAGDASTAALTNQVRRLTMELRQLASAQRPITVVNSGSSGGGGTVTLIVPLVVAGTAGYGYMWWKGITFKDLMYVTQRSMQTAVNSMGKQMEVLSVALAQTKQQLASRIANLNKTLDESVEMQGLLKDQMERVGIEVREEVERVGNDIETLQRLAEGLEGKLVEVAEKQDFANHGIVLLCRFVTQSLEGRQKQEALQGLSYLSRPAPRLEQSTSFTSPGNQGLKDLQSLAESLEGGSASGSGSSVSFMPMALPPPSTSVVHKRASSADVRSLGP
eukprot:TRINITY_DN11913_c0_g1_i2.p1 TRINITY_DN11913_c0_g1~~TRINITY_DN11913_c0_g1_i2.p1  ORF type:complete len:331 (-),score=58.40 TRINITY_DN11913_c0_g1_i2:681-1673(-)